MGFVRRLVEESSKQLKDVVKQVNEAMKELERQANEANSQRQRGSSSSSIHRTDTNNHNYIYPTNNNVNVQQETRGESRPVTFADLESEEQQLRNMYRQLIDDQIRQAEESITRNNNMVYVNDPYVQTPNYVNSALPVDPISQEQQLRNTRQKLIDDQIRRAEESITRMGAIGTSNNVVYVNNNPNVQLQTPRYVNSASRVDPISQEQQLRNMRKKLIDDQIRRADEGMTRMGVIGTNSHLVYTNDTLGNIR